MFIFKVYNAKKKFHSVIRVRDILSAEYNFKYDIAGNNNTYDTDGNNNISHA